jgi:macrodomain Ter protein organizer (MatP/YcbG family)
MYILGGKIMGRPAYKITDSDYVIAYNYIADGMTRGDISDTNGYMRFRNADTADKLQAWCDDYLEKESWQRLKNAVLAARKRQRDRVARRRKKSVDLDWNAWLCLSSMAREEGRTLSEMILAMDDVYHRAKAKGIKARF